MLFLLQGQYNLTTPPLLSSRARDCLVKSSTDLAQAQANQCCTRSVSSSVCVGEFVDCGKRLSRKNSQRGSRGWDAPRSRTVASFISSQKHSCETLKVSPDSCQKLICSAQLHHVVFFGNRSRLGAVLRP